MATDLGLDPGVAGAAQAGSKGGWGWNPLTDIVKATTSVGSWVDAHTQIGSFNPGVGAFAASAANMVPGLVNTGLQLGKDVVTGQEAQAGHLLGQVGSGLYHGLLDTGTDIATIGGLAPWTQGVEKGYQAVTGYSPQTLKQYATKPGEGLGGALFNDAANVAILADAGAGALTKMDQVGRIADMASKAEEAAKISAIDARLPAEEVAKAGAEGRAKFLAAETDGNPAMIDQVEGRAKTLARIDQLRTGAQSLIQPWHALRPFTKAAGEMISPETPSEAPVSPAEPPGTPGPEIAVRQGDGQGAVSPVKEGYTRVYRGSDQPEVNPEGPPHPQQGEWWTLNQPEGQGGYEHWQYTDIPTTAADRLRDSVVQDAQARGEGDTPVQGKDILMDHNNPAQAKWLDEAKVHQAEAPALTPPAAAPPEPVVTPPTQPNWFTTKGQLENVPRAYQSYLEQAKPSPEWIKNVVAKMPAPVIQLLQWMDAHSKRLDYQQMTRQQQRALAVRAREIENRPEVQALFGQAADIVKQRLPGVTPTVASNLVGQFVRAYVTRGQQLIEDLENHRDATEAAMPGAGHLLIDSQLGYSVHIPEELNTPEWRAQMYQLAEPYKALRKQASDAFFQSDFLGDRGQHDDTVALTKKEKQSLNKAMAKLQKAAGLEADVVPRQLAGLAKEKAWTEDEVGRAVGRSQAAMETMAQARTDFDRTRYVPASINTPEKLAAVADEIANRTVRDNGATFNPTSGKFLTMQDSPGYLVGALPHSVISVPLGEFMSVNPETGRLHGAEMIEHFTHGYQEAFGFPNIAVGTWVDDGGNVHIDPTQFLEGESNRDRALTLAAAREQTTVKELHTGDDIPVQNDPNDSAFFLKSSRSRDARLIQLRQFADKARIPEDAVDKFVSLMDQRAVQLANDHPERYTTPDAVYRSLRMSTLKQALQDGQPPEAEVAGTMVRLTMPSATNLPKVELSTGEPILGLEGTSELAKSMAQRQAMKTRMETTETPLQQYRRGVEGQQSMDDWMKAAKQKRLADAAAARAQQHVTDLEKMINERDVPINGTIALLRNKGETGLAKLYDKLDDPAISRVPPRWQPMVVAAKDLAKQIEAHPELEDILASFPKTFGDALDYAQEHGMDPAYMPDLTPTRVRQLIAGTAQLGGANTREQGKQFISGARKQRNAVLQKVGGVDTSIEALVAGLNQVTQETRTNMIVDWLDRVPAEELPTDAAGRRLGAPPGWVEYDPIRRGLLGVDTADGRVAVGATKMIPRAVAQAIKEYAGDPPTNPIYRGLRAVTNPWRSLMLTLNPGFYLKHFQGHILLAAISGGVDLKAWGQAWSAAREGYKNLPEVTGLNIAYAEGHTPSLVGFDSVADALKIGGKVEAAHYIADKMHSVIATTDSFARAVAYFAKVDKGATSMEALQYAMDAVIDYGNLSNTEKYWVRAIVPFYSFEKGVAKLVYRMPMDHPLAAAMLLHLGQWQSEQAVDDNGNPLPERYQGVVDLPLLGKVDMQKFSPFKDVSALSTPDGIIQSLQYGIQSVVRAGLGVAAPGTKASVKVDQYGRLVPDVSLGSQLAASFSGGPQGQVIQGGPLSHFFGIPTVSQDTLNKAGARNVLSQAEVANADQATQQKAAAAPVDSLALQQNLRHQLDAGTPTNLPTSPTGGQMFSQAQLQAAVQGAVDAQKAKAAITRAAHPTSRKGGGSRRSGKHSARVRYKLRQGFGMKTSKLK